MFCAFRKQLPQGWGFSTIFLSQGSRFLTFFVPRGWGICPFEKIPLECVCPGGGGWSGLELTDTLVYMHFEMSLHTPKDIVHVYDQNFLGWWMGWRVAVRDA